MTESPLPALVATDWLQAHLSDPQLRIFDCTGVLTRDFVNRGYEAHYERKHIPGAAYLDVADPKGPLTDPGSHLPYAWPNPAQFEKAIGEHGVDATSRVILYSASNPEVPGSGISFTTRAWWLMHHFGIDCAILDGGWQKWTAEGRPVSNEPQAYAPTTFRAAQGAEDAVVGKDDVLAAIDDERTAIVDSLSEASYRGEVDRNYGTFGRRKGHITNAVNVHFQDVLDPDTGCFLKPEAVRQRFEAQGITPNSNVITYCGAGLGATVNAFALKLAGYENISIYDGSLMEWANDPTVPMTDPAAEA